MGEGVGVGDTYNIQLESFLANISKEIMNIFWEIFKRIAH